MQTLALANSWWLALALLLLLATKALAAVRFNCFMRALSVHMPEGINMRLYFVGSFYNLFLPGGIGGDAYKVYYVHKAFKTPLKPLIAAQLLDRTTGLSALFILTCSFYTFSSYAALIPYSLILAAVGCAGSLAVNYWLLRRYLPAVLSNLGPVSFHSIVTQILYGLSAVCILLAIPFDGAMLDYIVLFYISCVVAVLPFTVGGVGARELTFLWGLGLLGVDATGGVAFSLLAFVLNALSCLPGLASMPEWSPKTAQ